jgi:hypothetical protein
VVEAEGVRRRGTAEVQAVRDAGLATGGRSIQARKASGWPKISKLTHAFLWEYSYKRLKLAQLLGQLGVFLT